MIIDSCRFLFIHYLEKYRKFRNGFDDWRIVCPSVRLSVCDSRVTDFTDGFYIKIL